jgi:hypothetical protein
MALCSDIISSMAIRLVFREIFGINEIILSGHDRLGININKVPRYGCAAQNETTIAVIPMLQPIYTYSHAPNNVSLIRLTSNDTAFAIYCEIDGNNVNIVAETFYDLEYLIDEIKNPIKKDLGLL